MAKTFEGRVLRLGVLYERRLIEERLLTLRHAVTVGSGGRNTIVIPAEGVPSSMPFVAKQQGHYYLVFTDKMKGRVSVGDRLIDLSDARQQKLAKRSGSHWMLELAPDSRGRVEIGDSMILFQFIKPPPVPATPQLPASMRGGWFQQMDMAMVASLVFSFVLQAGFAGGLNLWWERVGKYQVKPDTSAAERLLRPLKVDYEASLQLTHKPKDEKTKDESKDKTETEQVAKKEPAEEVVVKRAPRRKPKPARKAKPKASAHKKLVAKADTGRGGKASKRDAAAMRKRVEEVERTTVIHLLQAKGIGVDGGGPDTLDDAKMKEFDVALDADPGVRRARPGERVQFHGRPRKVSKGSSGFKRLSKKEEGGIEAHAVATAAKKEVAVKLKVSGHISEPVGLGTIDRDKVKRIFRRRQVAIRRCYEKQLRAHKDLAGKVTVQFTIGPAGRVTKVKVKKNTTGSKELAACVVRKLKSWSFPRPKGGQVTFVRPFVFRKLD